MDMLNEARRDLAPGVDLVVRGPGVEAADAVLAEVLLEMAAKAGGKLHINMKDPATVEDLARRLRAKGIDPDTGQWLS